ncbi:MAG: class I SAM-dependent methyltransferase [Sphingosinicella sp.]|nr:class I SAM-dependent methyltransferase [Sphingosinicella sp.]
MYRGGYFSAMVASARRRFGREIAAGTMLIFQGSAENLPVEDRSVDKVCSANTLYFWREPGAVMAEFARVLRRGGRLLLCFQSADQVRRWPGHAFGFEAYETDQIRSWFADTGFACVEVSSGVDSRLGDFLCLSGKLVDAKAGT